MNRELDVIFLGRAGVDLYAKQIGAKLEDVNSFAKYLGGSSANVAFGTARLGLKSAMLTRVGNEQMGHFVHQELASAGVDVSHIQFDDQRLTGLVLLAIKAKNSFPLLFYREQVADLAIDSSLIDEKFISSAKLLAITGTHFSSEHSSQVCRDVINLAKKHKTRIALDIDYRPVLWGLAKKGEGDNRYISSDVVSSHLQRILHFFDLIVGTEEEFCIAGGYDDIIQSLKNIRKITKAELVVKRGPLGCAIFNGAITNSLDEGLNFSGFKVEVFNVLGAGDAFFSGFLRGWINSESYEKCCAYANACGALTVSRHGCAPAMPSRVELDYYLKNYHKISQPSKDKYLNRLHKVTTRKKQYSNLCVLAFDHRSQLFDLAIKIQGNDAQIPYLKQLIFKGAKQTAKQISSNVSLGLLCDDIYGQDVLNEATGNGWWLARSVELPSSRPLEFEAGDNIAAHLGSWASEQVAKCLVFYHPDDPIELRLAQERKLKQLYDACQQTEHELLLEIIPPKNCKTDNQTLSRTMSRFYHLEIYPDWWKLPPQNQEVWHNLVKIIKNNDSYCRGISILGLDQPEQLLAQSFNDTVNFPLIKGFMIGRTIFKEAAKKWLKGDINDQQLVNEIAHNYERMIHHWLERK